MFHLNSLCDQIEKAKSQLNNCNGNSKKYTDKTRNIKGKLLFMTKFNVKYSDIYSHQNQMSSSIDDNSKSYTLRELHNTWKEKSNVNFNANHQKFLKNIIPKKVKEAKERVEKLVDPDTFNINLPRWNSASKLIKEHPISIKQSVFNITNGLTVWEGNDPKEPKIEVGVDSRSKDSQWNNSTLLIKKEKEELNDQTIHFASNNTQRYWHENSIGRKTHSQLPVSRDRRSYEKVRYYQDYKSPTKRIKTNAEIMAKVKNYLKYEREEMTKEVIKENPGCKHIKEKINAIVEKRMISRYMKQFNIAIGKINENQYYKSQLYKWKDDELIGKISTITNWKDIGWFKPKSTMKPVKNQEEQLRKDILKPLVINRKEITKEQDNIETSRINHYKKSLQKEKIKKSNVSSGDKWPNHSSPSKYPIDLSFYEKRCSGEYYNVPENNKDIDQKDKDFFDAYKTISLNKRKEDEKKNRELKKNHSCWHYRNYHPGKYRAFEYNKSKVIEDYDQFCEGSPANRKQKTGKETILAWSCCLNDDPDSNGCRKERSDNCKWNYDNA